MGNGEYTVSSSQKFCVIFVMLTYILKFLLGNFKKNLTTYENCFWGNTECLKKQKKEYNTQNFYFTTKSLFGKEFCDDETKIEESKNLVAKYQ